MLSRSGWGWSQANGLDFGFLSSWEKFNDDSEDQNEKDQIIEADRKEVGSKFFLWSVIQRKISKVASNVYSPRMGQ